MQTPPGQPSGTDLIDAVPSLPSMTMHTKSATSRGSPVPTYFSTSSSNCVFCPPLTPPPGPSSGASDAAASSSLCTWKTTYHDEQSQSGSKSGLTHTEHEEQHRGSSDWDCMLDLPLSQL